MVTLRLPDGQTRNVTSGKVEIPRTGIWMANLRVDAQDVLPDHVTLDLGADELPATISKDELIGGMTELRLVGGAGGIGEIARPKHYYQPLVRHVLADLLRDSGEKLSPTATASVLILELEAWTTMALATGSLLAALCTVAGDNVNWRILADGTLWLGVETWPDSGVTARTEHADGANAAVIVGTDIPGLWPGTLLDGRKVDLVTHDLEANRTTVLFAEGL
jgi:hypothetical protein